MLSPKTIHLIIKYLDCVDENLARRMIRKRPHTETTLTSRLCDLLDAETQAEEHLSYSLEDLNRELSQGDGLVSVFCEIETHEYTSDLERWVTQADLGFVINYRDHLIPEASWSVAWLLQAKRLTPNLHAGLLYTEGSAFGGVDEDQRKRMNRLRKAVGLEFIKYLLYCPRPSALDRETRAKLSHLRHRTLADEIFDYALGLESRDDLRGEASTLAAGIFVTGLEKLPHKLSQVHAGILRDCCPLSWFFASHFAGGNHRWRVEAAPTFVRIHPEQDSPDFTSLPLGDVELAHATVRGRAIAIEQLRGALDIPENRRFQVIPPHTITIDVNIGGDFDNDTRRIRLE